MNTAKYIDFMRELATISGEVIKPHFFRSGLEVESKSDDSPVTVADKEAEKVMRELIAERFPDHGIVGEEYGNQNENAEFVWTLDPIDGTISFASGVPLFGTIVAILHNGKPIAGMIYQPILDLLCLGDGKETTLNGETVRVRDVTKIENAVLVATDIANIEKYQNKSGFDTLVETTKVFRTWGDCYGYLLLASGWADIMLDPIMNPWDKYPLIPIITGAGGVITGWDGSDAADSDSIVSAHPNIHSQVLDILSAS